MGKSIPLASAKSLEVDEVVFESQFVFSLQITTIEGRIIGGQAIWRVGVIEPADRFADRRQGAEGARLHIGARTQFEADGASAEIDEEVGPMERNLHTVPDPPQVGE
jgi:hypothetical protein